MSLSTLSKINQDILGPSKLSIENLVGHNDVILGNIFSNLHGKDLKVCRQVCRKWRDVSQFQFKTEMNMVVDEAYLRRKGRNCKRNFESFLHDFGENIPLDSVKLYNKYCVAEEDKWIIKFLELFGDEIKSLTVVVCHSRRQMLMNQLWAFRFLIFKYFLNLENLSLIFVAADKQTMPDHAPCNDSYSIPWISNYGKITGIELLGLKSVKYLIHEKSYWNYDTNSEVVRTLFDILSAAKNLETLKMNLNPNNTTTLLRIPPESLRNLKKLSLVDWKCSYFQVLRAIRNLADDRVANFKLETLSLRCNCPHYGYSGVEDIHSKFFLIFLRSQKDCLKNLILTHPPFPGSALNTECRNPFFNTLHGADDFDFPKLEKLERFSLRNSYSNFVWVFSDRPNWTALFPKLKKFDYHYVIDPGYSAFPKLLENMMIPCGSVSEVTLTVNTFLSCSDIVGSPDEDIQSIKGLFRLVKEKFPNLRFLNVRSEKFKRYWVYKGGFSHDSKRYTLWSVTNADPDEIVVNEYKFFGKIEEERNQREGLAASTSSQVTSPATDDLERDYDTWLRQIALRPTGPVFYFSRLFYILVSYLAILVYNAM